MSEDEYVRTGMYAVLRGRVMRLRKMHQLIY
jgi:hypothetical protein